MKDNGMPYFTTSDGCKIYFETHGFETANPGLVFLNGTTQTTLNWRPQALYFKDIFRVILYDSRTQGKSAPGKKKLSLDLHANDLSDLLDFLDVKKAHLVGLSHGAHVALALAAKRPKQVARLVLCSIGSKHSARTKTVINSWLEILKKSDLESMAWAVLPIILGEIFLKENEKILDKMVKAIMLRNRKEPLIKNFEAMLTYPSPSCLVDNICHPCLFLSGAEDPLVSPESAKYLAGLCNGGYKKIEACGHTVSVEKPGVFNQLVFEFLQNP